MKKLAFALSLVAVLVLVGCQTTPPKATETPAAAPAAEPTPAPVATEPVAEKPDPSTVAADETGFSPLAQSPHNTLLLRLHFGHPAAVTSWSLDLVDAQGTSVRHVEGQAPDLPATFSWDGNDNESKPASEGRYTARLVVNSGASSPESVESAPFLLDLTPASGTISVDPSPFEPGDPSVMVNPPLVNVTLHIVPGTAEVTTWRLFVVHPNGSRFMDFISEDHGDNQVAWNGRAQNNAGMEPGVTYQLMAQVFDRYGNVGTLKGELTVAAAKPAPEAAPVTVSLDGQLVASTQIYFPAYSADLSLVGPAKKAPNEAALDALAEALKAVGGARIEVIGHANKVFWQDEARGQREQEQTLIPLSKARAEAVRDALVARGLSASEFTLKGVGAEGALAPFSDSVNNWKNRRVEFVVQEGGQ